MSMAELKGRTAVVTGASRGIGADLARVFAEQGLNLGLCARGESVLANGDCVVAERLDVRDEQAVQALADRVIERFGQIDLWVNNAGVLAPIAPIREIGVEAFREHVDINLTGVFVGTRTFARHVRGRAGGGVLINISSGAAWKGYSGWGPYCAGKGGLERLTDCIAIEEADAGLRAYAVAPGVVDTDMQEMIRGCTAEQFAEVERFRQLKRDNAYNSGEFVASEILALAFDPKRASSEVSIRL